MWITHHVFVDNHPFIHKEYTKTYCILQTTFTPRPKNPAFPVHGGFAHVFGFIRPEIPLKPGEFGTKYSLICPRTGPQSGRLVFNFGDIPHCSIGYVFSPSKRLCFRLFSVIRLAFPARRSSPLCRYPSNRTRTKSVKFPG